MGGGVVAEVVVWRVILCGFGAKPTFKNIQIAKRRFRYEVTG
jgi:hypothetical protein